MKEWTNERIPNDLVLTRSQAGDVNLYNSSTTIETNVKLGSSIVNHEWNWVAVASIAVIKKKESMSMMISCFLFRNNDIPREIDGEGGAGKVGVKDVVHLNPSSSVLL